MVGLIRFKQTPDHDCARSCFVKRSYHIRITGPNSTDLPFIKCLGWVYASHQRRLGKPCDSRKWRQQNLNLIDGELDVSSVISCCICCASA